MKKTSLPVNVRRSKRLVTVELCTCYCCGGGGGGGEGTVSVVC